MTDSKKQRPLDGVRVVDASRVLAGPYCAYLLSLLGAQVTRIERPPHGDSIRWRTRVNRTLGDLGLSTDYIAQGANKRLVMLDLAERDGRTAFLDLLAESDVLVENFRTGALDRLGLDRDTIGRVNPGLVWCSVTGYGRSGERAEYPAYDSVIQAASGLMNLTGTAQSGPLKAGASIIDYTTGLNAALGVVSALMLRERGRTEGSRVEVSMLDTALAMMQSTVSGVLNGAETLRPRGNAASSGNLLSRDYPTQDGMVCIAVNEPRQLRALLSALGIAVGQEGSPAVDSDLLVQVASRVARYASNDLDGLLNRAGVPCAPVQGLDEAIGAASTADPKLIQKGRSGELRYVMLPFRLNDDRGAVELDPTAPVS